MKKGLSLIITCLMFTLMSASVVSAAGTVSSGDGVLPAEVVSVSGNGTVSGGDIQAQGNISN